MLTLRSLYCTKLEVMSQKTKKKKEKSNTRFERLDSFADGDGVSPGPSFALFPSHTSDANSMLLDPSRSPLL